MAQRVANLCAALTTACCHRYLQTNFAERAAEVHFTSLRFSSLPLSVQPFTLNCAICNATATLATNRVRLMNDDANDDSNDDYDDEALMLVFLLLLFLLLLQFWLCLPQCHFCQRHSLLLTQTYMRVCVCVCVRVASHN